MQQQATKIIEKATAADYPEIVEVWEASVRETHHFLTETLFYDINFEEVKEHTTGSGI